MIVVIVCLVVGLAMGSVLTVWYFGADAPDLDPHIENEMRIHAEEYFDKEILPQIHEKMNSLEGVIALKALKTVTEAMDQSKRTGLPVQLEIAGNTFIVTPPQHSDRPITFLN